MGRHRSNNKGSLTYQIKQAIDSKMAIGDSKHLDKIDGKTSDKIYSYSTRENYIKNANYFAKWCKDTYGCKTLEQCHSHVNDYLKHRIEEGKSAWTIKLEASAIAKVYGETTEAYAKTPMRERTDVVRSRGEVQRDKYFSLTNNREIIDFAKSTGLRRAELQNIKGNALRFDDQGRPFLRVTEGTKGGRYRETPIVADNETMQRIVNLMQEKGDGFVFKKVPSKMDVHGYRAEYATTLYKAIARDIKDIPYDKVNKTTGKRYQSEVYICRGDKKGIRYDKKAMMVVSNALGHNRLGVIASHYLRF